MGNGVVVMVVLYSPHGSHKYMKVPDCKHETELESCDPNFQTHRFSRAALSLRWYIKGISPKNGQNRGSIYGASDFSDSMIQI